MSATMLRSLPRAGQSSLYLRPSFRTNIRPSKTSIPICPATMQSQQTRGASAQHAISNPTLAGIEKRWEQMNPQEQADLWMALRDRMKIDWHDLTIQEKKAGQYILISRGSVGQWAVNRADFIICLRHAIDPAIHFISQSQRSAR